MIIIIMITIKKQQKKLESHGFSGFEVFGVSVSLERYSCNGLMASLLTALGTMVQGVGLPNTCCSRKAF